MKIKFSFLKMLAIVHHCCLQEMFTILRMVQLLNFEMFPFFRKVTMDRFGSLFTPWGESSILYITEFGNMVKHRMQFRCDADIQFSICKLECFYRFLIIFCQIRSITGCYNIIKLLESLNKLLYLGVGAMSLKTEVFRSSFLLSFPLN